MLTKCKRCKHHDDYSCVCCNADSSYVGDFTDNEDWCSHYESDYERYEKPGDSGA